MVGGITNGNNNAVRVYQVNCEKSSTAKPAAPDPATASEIETTQNQGIFTFTTAAVNKHTIKCNGAPTSPGSDFSGKIWVFYQNSEDDHLSYPIRVATANIVTKVG
jgi:hypothetical protein